MAAEGFSMAMGAVIWARYTPAHAPLILGLYAFLLFVTLTDLKYRRVFNIATYSAAGMVLLALLLMPHRTVLMQHLVGGAMAFGIFALASITTRGALGGGDIKLAGVLGLAFGFPGILWVLLIGTGLGALLAVGALLSGLGSRTTRIAYAPFLCAGALVMLLLLAR
jgi:prepilin signal peptidase PulO-like enzyme (type II secretory pathway)